MAKFRMILLGSQRIEINSKNTNEVKLQWFLNEIKTYNKDNNSILFIKIYRSNRKFFEINLSQKDINELSLKWIEYKEKD